MRLELIEGIRLLIVAILVYVPTVTISGWFTAWVAKKCDDDLPERFGFLTFDPFAHCSLVGFGLLIIGKFFGDTITLLKDFPGFGRFIILEPAPHAHKAKVVLEFLARSVAHFIMLFVSFVCIVLFFKGSLLYPSSAWMSQAGSLFEAFRDILYFFFDQNRTLWAIYCLIGIADSICYFLHIPRFFSWIYFGVLIGTFLICGPIIQFGLKALLLSTEQLLALL